MTLKLRRGLKDNRYFIVYFIIVYSLKLRRGLKGEGFSTDLTFVDALKLRRGLKEYTKTLPKYSKIP